jgi:hypothetical protein
MAPRLTRAAIAAAAALVAIVTVAPAAPAAARRSSNPALNCGGSGVTAAYCIPQISRFSFAGVHSGPGCSLSVTGHVLPTIANGPRGRVQLRLRGTGTATQGIHRSADPVLRGSNATATFGRLVSGRYALTGWYGGDSVREASAKRSLSVRVRCH